LAPSYSYSAADFLFSQAFKLIGGHPQRLYNAAKLLEDNKNKMDDLPTLIKAQLEVCSLLIILLICLIKFIVKSGGEKGDFDCNEEAHANAWHFHSANQLDTLNNRQPKSLEHK
jgi:hypothetical protein